MKKPFVLGLTGSIGMGKSTTAQMFRDAGVPVWDADAAVHRLYARGGAAVAAIAELRPQAIVDGAVSREALRAWLSDEPGALARIEAVVHPLVAEDRLRFLEQAAAEAADLVVLDVPLLYETGADRLCDAVVVVTVPPDLQKQRVMSRSGITEAMFEQLLAKQMPDAEKRARADHILETLTLEDTRAKVNRLVQALRGLDRA